MFWWDHLGNIWFSEPNFMKSKNQFLIWKIIYFLCTLSQLYILCWDCFFLFFSYTHHLSLPPSPVKPIGTLPASSPVSPSLPFPSLFLFLSFSFDITKRKESGGNSGEPGQREEGAVGCHWRRQPATFAIIDGGDGRNTSVGRDIEEGRVGIPNYEGSMVGSVVYPQKGSFGCFEGD